MSLEILFEQPVNILYRNRATLHDILESSIIVYDLVPNLSSGGPSHDNLAGKPTETIVDEFYYVDEEGLLLWAHQRLKLKYGQIIDTETSLYRITQRISQEEAEEIQHRATDGLLYLGQEETFRLGRARVEHPTMLLSYISAKINNIPEVLNGYLLVVEREDDKFGMVVVPYESSLVDQTRELVKPHLVSLLPRV